MLLRVISNTNTKTTVCIVLHLYSKKKPPYQIIFKRLLKNTMYVHSKHSHTVHVLSGIGPCVDPGSTYVKPGSTYVDVCRPKFTAVDPGSTQGPIPRSTCNVSINNNARQSSSKISAFSLFFMRHIHAQIRSDLLFGRFVSFRFSNGCPTYIWKSKEHHWTQCYTGHIQRLTK